MNRCNSRENVQITLDADFNVPDIKPDARAIMQECVRSLSCGSQ